MRLSFITLIAIFLGIASLPLLAHDFVFKSNGPAGTLLELYSSEGCSSCPPAEAWVSKLKSSPGLWTKSSRRFPRRLLGRPGLARSLRSSRLHPAPAELCRAARPGFRLHAGVRRQRSRMARLVRWRRHTLAQKCRPRRTHPFRPRRWQKYLRSLPAGEKWFRLFLHHQRRASRSRNHERYRSRRK